MPFHGREHHLFIQRIQGSKIHDLHLSGEADRNSTRPMHTHTVSDDTTAIPHFHPHRVCRQNLGRHSERKDIIPAGFRPLGILGEWHFAPVEPFVLQHQHRVRIKERGLHQAFHIRRVRRIHDFDALDGEQSRFNASAMVRPASAVSAHRHADERLHREPAHREVTGFGKLRHELVETGIDIIRELHFHDGFHARGTHARHRAYDIRFLDGSVEHPVISELLRQRGGLTEHAAQSPADILPVQYRTMVILHDLPNGLQCRVDHHDAILTALIPVTRFRYIHRIGADMVRHRPGIGLRRLGCPLEVIRHDRTGFLPDIRQLVFGNAAPEQGLLQLQKGIPPCTHLQLRWRPVKLLPDATRMMTQQGHIRLHHPWTRPCPHFFHDAAHLFVADLEIGSIQLQPVHTPESGSISESIHGPGLTGSGTDAPLVILHQEYDREFHQNRHLEGLAHLPFRDARISQ